MIDNVSDGGPYRNDRQCLEARIKKLEARNRCLRRVIRFRLIRGFRHSEQTRLLCAIFGLAMIIYGGTAALMLIFLPSQIVTPRADSTVRITPPLVVTGYEEEDSLELDIDSEELQLAYDRYPNLWDWDQPICARPFQIFDPELWIWIQCERRMCLGPLRNR